MCIRDRRRGEQGQGWSAFGAEPAERGRSPSGASQREEHAGSDVEGGIGSGERGRQHDEVHEMRGAWEVDRAEYGNEWTLGHPGAVPWHDADEDDDGS